MADQLLEPVGFARDRRQLPAGASGARVIGITAFDMHMEAMRDRWLFTFSLRSPDRRFAVVSFERMDPANLGEPADSELLRSRLRKMLAKNIGLMCYGLPASDNPRSVLYRNILGVDDPDRMGEDFDPR